MIATESSITTAEIIGDLSCLSPNCYYNDNAISVSYSNDEGAPTSIPATVFSLTEKYNEISFKGRARIFYKGANRNRTFISEEFANKLIQSVPYTPLKGIWDNENLDFTDHGTARTEGRIYGVVLENPNFAWEEYEDIDGIVRTYACVDVIIYTGIYPEAEQIIGKSLSMELLPSSIQGAWEIYEGCKVFHFQNGAFAGLQVLGDEVEPCFEGAAFYELKKSAQDLYQKIIEYEMKNGGKNMADQKNFSFSNEKMDAIWNALNPEETACYSIVNVGEDKVIAYNYADNAYASAVYTIDDNGITLGDYSAAHCIFMDDEAYSAYELLMEKGESYSQINDSFAAISAELETEKQKNFELTETLTQKEADFTALNDTVAEKDVTIASLTQERDELLAFKNAQEDEKKKSLCTKYAAKLDESIIQNYTNSLSNYTYEELERELAIELVNSTPSLFTQQVPMIPKDRPATGIEAILDGYKK